MKGSSLSVNVLFHQSDVYLQRGVYKSGTYNIFSGLYEVEICHCTDCQSLSGSAFHTIVPAKEGTFELLNGELKKYAKTADDGAIRIQSFCPECGSPICSSPPEGAPGVLRIRIGALKQRNLLVPKKQYWVRSSQPWTQVISEMEKIETE